MNAEKDLIKELISNLNGKMNIKLFNECLLILINEMIENVNNYIRDNTNIIVDGFSNISVSLNSQSTTINSFVNENKIHQEGVNNVHKCKDLIQGNISQIIIGSQFQDRVNQQLIILGNLTNLMVKIPELMIDKVSEDLIEQIFNVFTLSETRKMLLRILKAKKLIANIPDDTNDLTIEDELF